MVPLRLRRVYPGLFAAGGLDVMTAALLRADFALAWSVPDNFLIPPLPQARPLRTSAQLKPRTLSSAGEKVPSERSSARE